MTARRHPALGFLAGFFLGLGVALLLIVFGVVPLTVMWLVGLTVAGIVLGVAWAYITPVRGRNASAAPDPSG